MLSLENLIFMSSMEMQRIEMAVIPALPDYGFQEASVVSSPSLSLFPHDFNIPEGERNPGPFGRKLSTNWYLWEQTMREIWMLPVLTDILKFTYINSQYYPNQQTDWR